ncbi:MAG: FtsX-like permease family protein, partial [Pseudomonadota bacterium]
VVEIALAVVLLVGAGLILRSFSALLSVDPGFDTERVLVLATALPADRYQPPQARQSFYTRAFPSLRNLAGVEAIGAAAVVPLTGNNWTVPFERADRPVPAGQRPPDVGWQAASGGYFEALHIPLVAGRLFDWRDSAEAPPVVIVSEAIQKQFYGTEPALGRRVKIGDELAEIVGVVGNIRRAGLTDTPRADLYFPFERAPGGATNLFIRTSGDPLAAVSAVQGALKAIEPSIVMNQPRTLEAIASESVAVTRLALWLMSLFAIVALSLAAVGIYGVMSCVVRQRTREIGTRIALGATRRDIVWTIMRQGLTISSLGLAIGIVAGLLMARSLTALLYGITASDPLTLTCALAVLASATLFACYVPARRAARVDAARTLAG